MLTKSGLGALVAAIVMIGAGLLWRYPELVVVAAGLLALIVVSVVAVRAQQPSRIERIIPNPRVARGDVLPVEYQVNNPTRRRSPPLAVVDELAGRTTSTAIPSLQKRDRVTISTSLPALRRGIHRIGPGSVERTDPFWFATGRRQELRQDEVIIHPRVYLIDGPFGSLHAVAEEALSRSIATDPLSGFVSMREYVDGDDPRLIHWPTTARTGELMVREHVELRRPQFAIVVDTSSAVATPLDFEEVVDVAASLGIHALRSGINVRLATTNPAYLGPDYAFGRDTEVLDFLTPVRQSPPARTIDLGQVLELSATNGVVVFITGPDGPSSPSARPPDVQVIRIGEGASRTEGIAVVAATAAQFAHGPFADAELPTESRAS